MNDHTSDDPARLNRLRVENIEAAIAALGRGDEEGAQLLADRAAYFAARLRRLESGAPERRTDR